MVVGITLCFTGCSSNSTTDNPSGDISGNSISIEDIALSVDEGVVDGDRFVLLTYTNNTQYTISSFELTFKEKANITDEEKETFYADVQENFEMSNEDMEDLKDQPISMHAKTDRVVEPGESISNVNCYYYSGIFYLKDIDHYNLVEPDIATIKYIDEDQIYTIYYDYNSKKYSTESETEIAYQWSQTDLGNKIPKPDVKVVESGRDDESVYMFDAYGLSLDQFNDYVEKCKELGYTVDPGSFEGFYSADDEDGYNVYLYYNEDSDSMSGIISAPEVEGE